jgi:uncharacterized protein (DUF2141 family)
MKQANAWFSCLLFFTVTALAQEPKSGRIVVNTDGYKSEKGFAMIALHNTSHTFLKKKEPFRKERIAITLGTAKAVFNDIPYGTYSIAVFHDENSNFDLDASIVGIPKEDYGFSNNARKKYGPPKYNDTLFTLDAAEKTLEIRVAPAIP